MIALISSAALFLTVTALEPPKNIYGFTMKNIEGKNLPLKKFKGKVLLVVNVASQCGNTVQYAALEKLYEEYKGKGLVVLGFPANNFGGQEPGTDSEIQKFCTSKYGVKFPMFSKISVKGDDTHPLYKWLIENAPMKDDVEWNFAKFLVNRKGEVVGRFRAKTQPNSDEVLAAIKKELG